MDYGKCDRCGADLISADWFEDIEYDSKTMLPTGRVRWAVGYIVCPECGRSIVLMILLMDHGTIKIKENRRDFIELWNR